MALATGPLMRSLPGVRASRRSTTTRHHLARSAMPRLHTSHSVCVRTRVVALWRALARLTLLTAGGPLAARLVAQPAPFVVGTARAAVGTVARGVLAVPAGVDSGYDIPVVVAHGARPGPTLALVAGLHGTEFGGVVALQRLATRLDPARLAGRVIVVPLVNVASFHRLVPHLNPVDGKNMNRVFPGSRAGTQSERAAHLLTTEVLARADVVIDYHGGDLDEDQRPYAYWIQTGDAARDSTNRALLLAFGIDHLIRYPVPGLTRERANLLPTQATPLGKPAITVDAGRAGTYTSDDVTLLVEGTLNVMGRLGMLDRPVTPLVRPLDFDRTLSVASAHTGTFVPLVGRGAYVARGTRLGYVTDGWGQPLGDAVAPEAGVVLYLRSTASVTQGGQLVYLGVPSP
jgi:predicted deacylase